MGTPLEKLSRRTEHGDAPYITVPLRKPERMDLHEMIRGSREGKVQAPDFLRSTAETCGYGDVKITASRLPYR